MTISQIEETPPPDDALTDAAATLHESIRDYHFVLVVREPSSGHTRQYSNGMPASQLEMLDAACEAMKHLINQRKH